MGHGVSRNQRKDYLGNMLPTIWRAQKVQQPPPLMVYKETGEVAPPDQQLKARPFFTRGVSHWLFPTRRSGYHALRKTAKGHWVGKLRGYRVHEEILPRL